MCFIVFSEGFLLSIACGDINYEAIWKYNVRDTNDYLYVLECNDGLHVAFLEKKAFLWTGISLEASFGESAAAGFVKNGRKNDRGYHIIAEYTDEAPYPEAVYEEEGFDILVTAAEGERRVWIALAVFTDLQEYQDVRIYSYLEDASK